MVMGESFNWDGDVGTCQVSEVAASFGHGEG